MSDNDDDFGGRRKKRSRGGALPQRRSEVHIPLTSGTVIRARYIGPGGGSLNVFCGEDIAVHVNPRPHEGLVLNSHFGGWGPEERPDDYPFPDGDEVVLFVRIRADRFVIEAKVAGWETFEYEYRFRHNEELTHFAIDIPGLIGLAVQPGA